MSIMRVTKQFIADEVILVYTLCINFGIAAVAVVIDILVITIAIIQ